MVGVAGLRGSGAVGERAVDVDQRVLFLQPVRRLVGLDVDVLGQSITGFTITVVSGCPHHSRICSMLIGVRVLPHRPTTDSSERCA